MDSKQAGNSNSVAKRLQSELMSLMMASIKGISAFPDHDNLLNWVGTIAGPKDTVYEALSFKISLKFPQNYPMSPPNVQFLTPIFHPV